MIFSVAADLGLLAVFKYADFFITTVNAFPLPFKLPLAELVLPVGISFYTFTQIAFLVDTHRGFSSEYKPVHYTLFVTYFPHLVAGPILHHGEMMPQFASDAVRKPRLDNFVSGGALFVIGLSKKVLLADTLGTFATGCFTHVESGNAASLAVGWSAALTYSFQLYFDFSGYTDMALGMSRMMGIKLPENFNSPYKSANIIEFWKRWHITLSRFLRDYLYIPLGGNRRGAGRRHLNLIVTMLLGGLWHGASWNFVVWGGLHGAFLSVNHLYRAICPPPPPSRNLRSISGLRGCLTGRGVAVAFC